MTPPIAPYRSGLVRLAVWCHVRRRTVVAGWLTLILGAVIAAVVFGATFRDDFRIEGVESQRAHDLLAERFDFDAGADARVVWRAERGVTDQSVRLKMDDLLDQMARLDHVSVVYSPYEAPSTAISPDGRTGFATIRFDVPDDQLPPSVTDEFKRLIEGANDGVITVGGSGDALSEFVVDAGITEAVGLVVAIAVLLMMFGTVAAAGLPVITALSGVGVAIAGLAVFSNWIQIPAFAAPLATMIGLGAGIDYALFIVNRYRVALRDGLSPEAATAVALATSGRAVVFAGSVVVVSLVGMVVVGIGFVSAMAVSAAWAVLLTLAAALTLLPAMLGFAGHRINGRALASARSDHLSDTRTSVWWRWSRIVQRRPLVVGIGAVALLIVLALPTYWLQVGVADEGSDTAGSATRIGYDLLADGFGPGFNGPLAVVAAVSTDDPTALQRLREDIARTRGVAYVAPLQMSADASAALIAVFPQTAPQDEDTANLVGRLRDAVIPLSIAGTDLRVAIGGRTAYDIDAASMIQRRLPWFIASVLAVSSLLLMVIFRSLLLPLKAVMMNVLSIGAAYGVVVAVFQWGWLASWFGVDTTGPIEPFFPIFLFAVLFGLSMDYEVFILGRIQEEYLASGDNTLAVADGLAASARLITAAAAIMIAIFGSALFADLRVLKLFGLGLSVAILVDASIVRLIVVPATMELMGRANWWLPSWIERRLPRLHA